MLRLIGQSPDVVRQRPPLATDLVVTRRPKLRP